MIFFISRTCCSFCLPTFAPQKKIDDMKKDRQIRMQMVRVVGDLAPFVKIDYIDSEAQDHSALLLVDSCSCDNILFVESACSLGLVYTLTDKTIDIDTITNTKLSTSIGRFAFAFEGGQFVEPFCICDGKNNLPKRVGDMPIVGILGNIFLQKYNLAIDFSDYTLHTSNASQEAFSMSACDFFFPMEIGLKNYGLPVLSLRQAGKEIVALADSGATDNILSLHAITETGLDCEYLETTDSIVGMVGSVESKDTVMNFCLLTLTEDDIDEVSHRDAFKVLPHTLVSPEKGKCDDNGNLLPPVEGIIGSPFMAKENWVLDFGAKIIYRRKVENTFDWNVCA